MAGWHVIESFIKQAGDHSTWAGKFYNTFFDCFRLLFLVSIVDNTFKERDLQCDTKVPGCQKMCTNQFLPINVLTFWAFQIFSVCLPTVIYMTYVVHKQKAIEDAKKVKDEIETKNRKKRQLELDYEKKCLEAMKNAFDDTDGGGIDEIEYELQDLEQEANYIKEGTELQNKLNKHGIKATRALEQSDLTPPKLFLGYFLMVLTRSAIEIVYLWAYFQIYIFDLIMPKYYYCNESPCLSLTTCFVARPNEKTWVLHIMFILALFTLSCSLIELFRLGIEKPLKAFKNRHKDISQNPQYMPPEQNIIPTFAA
jgi:hypothetical protein